MEKMSTMWIERVTVLTNDKSVGTKSRMNPIDWVCDLDFRSGLMSFE